MAPGRLQGAGVHDICHAGGAQARPGGEVQRASATGKRVQKVLLGRQNARPDPVVPQDLTLLSLLLSPRCPALTPLSRTASGAAHISVSAVR